MMLFYALVCRIVPKKLVAMCVVYHIKQNKMHDNAPVYELVEKIG